MLTAEREVEQKVRGLRAGADDYLIKPFHPAELMARIKSLLARFAPRDALVGRPPLGRVAGASTARRAAWGRRRSRSTRRSRSIASSAGRSALVDGNLQFGDHRVFLDLGLDQKSIVDIVTAPIDRPGPHPAGPRQARFGRRPAARAAIARDRRARHAGAHARDHRPAPGALRLHPDRHRQAARRRQPRDPRGRPTRCSSS